MPGACVTPGDPDSNLWTRNSRRCKGPLSADLNNPEV
jgi:hypothetical protein